MFDVRQKMFARAALTALLVVGVGASGASAGTRSDPLTPDASTVIGKVLSPNGSALTVSFTTPGKTAEVTFSGLNGQAITSLSTSAGTFSSNCDVQLSLQNPSGSTLAGPICAGQAGSLPPQTLTTDGTYKIVIAPTPTVTGSLKLTLKSTGTLKSITPNAKGLKVTLNAGASASFGTIVTGGVTLSALATSTTGFSGCHSYQISILKPDHSVLATQAACDTTTDFIDATLGAGAGTYTVEVDNLGTTKGTTTLSFYSFKDITGKITPSSSGFVKTLKKNFPGQNTMLTFTGTLGQKISVKMTGMTSTPDCWDLNLIRPDKTVVTSVAECGTNDGFLDATALDQTGTWTLQFNPRFYDIAGGTATAYFVSDQTFGITPSAGGVAKSLNLTTPGANGLLTFTGSIGQRISANLTGPSNFPDCYDLFLVRPDGSNFGGDAPNCGTGGSFLDAQTLDQNGTWTVRFDPRWFDTGSATVTTYLVTDQTFGVTPSAGGAAKSFNLTTPGANGLITFTGSIGQRISANLTGLSNFPDCYDLFLVRPDGSNFGADAPNCGTNGSFLDAQTLDQNGTWTLRFDPRSVDTGAATLTTYLVTDQTFSITPTSGGVAKSFNLTTPGANGLITFTGSIGQRISANLTGLSNFPDCYDLFLVRPDGSNFGADAPNCGTNGSFLDAQTLDQNGTWTVRFDPRSADTGSATLTTYLVTDQTGTISKGGASKSVAISTPGQNARFTFSGTSGTSVTANVTSAAFSGTGCYGVEFVRPDGTIPASTVSCNATVTLGPFVLDASGTWTVVVDPQDIETGTATLALT
jgi:hypothetical protein